MLLKYSRFASSWNGCRFLTHLGLMLPIVLATSFFKDNNAAPLFQTHPAPGASKFDFEVLQAQLRMSIPHLSRAGRTALHENLTSVQNINQNSKNYLGQKVALTGTIDRVIGPGSFILLDDKGKGNSAILVLTQQPSLIHSRQQAGTAAPFIKNRDKVKVAGKVATLTTLDADHSVLPTANKQMAMGFSTLLPVLIIEPGSVQRQTTG